MSPSLPIPLRRPRRLAAAILSVFVVSGASFGTIALAQDEPAGSVTLYTSVTQDTVDAVLAPLAKVAPGITVDVFRAPTGELDARIATELRTGGLGADVLWLTDPLSMERYAADGLLAPLVGDAYDAVPAEYRGDDFVGTRLLNLVIVAGTGLEAAPVAWSDLADPGLAGRVAMPDPGFAGSAYAALGYFGTAEDVGMAFYEALKENGVVVLQSPNDVLTGVAEGRYDAGITLDKTVRDAAEAGSPVELVWPEPGAISIFSPAAVTLASEDPAAANAFVEFLVSVEAQEAIAGTGWQPVLADAGPPAEGPVIAPDWTELTGRQAELLDAYRTIFGD